MIQYKGERFWRNTLTSKYIGTIDAVLKWVCTHVESDEDESGPEIEYSIRVERRAGGRGRRSTDW